MEWGRSRSGCFFCFYQQKVEWVRLKEHHPDLFEEAKRYEEQSVLHGEEFFWNQRESLSDLERPERMQQIKDEWDLAQDRKRKARGNLPLVQILGGLVPDDGDEVLEGCLICSL
jgi:hypothetical protein